MGARRTLGIVAVAVALLASSSPARAQTGSERAGTLVLAIGVPVGLGLGLASLAFHGWCEQFSSFKSAFEGDSSGSGCTAMWYVSGFSFGVAGLSVLAGILMIAGGGKKAVAARERGPIPRLEAAVAPGGGQLTATWTF